MDKSKIKELKKLSAQARHAMVDMLICAGCGHPGGAMSSVDMMTALFFDQLKIDPKNPDWDERDRFILSKGHSSIGLYAVMHFRGFFDKETLLTFRQDNSILGGHPDMHKVPGVEMSTGSLGHGLSVGIGLALAAKMDKKDYKTYVLMGDGETQEGSIWEAAMSAAHYKLDNLIGIVDRNMIQIDGRTEDVMDLEPYVEKWKAFGWNVVEIDGHDFEQILPTLKKIPFESGKPSLIISNTVKGKGISFMEDTHKWHGGGLKGEDAEVAKKEAAVLIKEHE
ncbi:MAG: transketolase [Candidatus Margulisiibacteriota bacterium]|nr:transketolase [Candidatus Margulisiibacteriota bacterium]